MEGYIKFNCVWDESPIPAEIDLKEINALRDAMVRMGGIGMLPGTEIGFGNVSRRLGAGFLISGTQTGNISHLSESDYAFVSAWDFATNSLNCTGRRRASSESLSHAAVYDALPDVNFIAHIHHAQLWRAHLWKLPTTPEYAEFGTVELAMEITKICKEATFNGAIALAGHEDGLIFCGRTAEEVIERIARNAW